MGSPSFGPYPESMAMDSCWPEGSQRTTVPQGLDPWSLSGSSVAHLLHARHKRVRVLLERMVWQRHRHQLMGTGGNIACDLEEVL